MSQNGFCTKKQDALGYKLSSKLKASWALFSTHGSQVLSKDFQIDSSQVSDWDFLAN